MKNTLRFIVLLSCLCAAFPSFSQTTTTTVYSRPENNKAYRPFITAYAGLGWYYWNDYSSVLQSTTVIIPKQGKGNKK